MPSQEMLSTWEKTARAEDDERKEHLKTAYDKVCQRRAKTAHMRPEQKVTLSLTCGELAAIKQFMMKFYDN
jgi:hypothetical protein